MSRDTVWRNKTTVWRGTAWRGAARIALILLLLAVTACGLRPVAQSRQTGPSLATPAPPFSGPIVFITLSGLRPDAVGALGGEHFWTPHIDAFTDEADWVGTAIAGSSTPVVALVSLMTGVSPWKHQVLTTTPTMPRSGIPLLSQALTERGYRTVARVPLDYNLNRFNLLAGFDDVAEIAPASDSSRSLEDLSGDPELYWFHLREANVSYQRRDEELPHLADRSTSLPWSISARRLMAYADPEVPMSPSVRSATWELFRHEVAWADHQVGQLLGSLRRSDVWEDTWVILTATQGTELGEHGQVLYSQNLGRESIEVPLMIKLPRSLRGSLEESPRRVSQLRLWATLVEATGDRAAPMHEPSLLGRDDPLILSELYQRNGVNEFSLLADDVQLIWATRFAAAEPEFYSAQLAQSGGRPMLTEPARKILSRLERAFRKTPPLSGLSGGEFPELRLEKWGEKGTTAVENRALAEELATELRRKWHRFVDHERSPEEEAALSESFQ